MEKKWMLKIDAGKKISLIMEKITVDFVLVTSSVYHCFCFCIHLRWSQRLTNLTLGRLLQDCQGSAVFCCFPSVLNLITLQSVVRLKPYRARQDPSWDCGYCFSSGCCCSEGSGLPEQDGCWCLGDDWSLGSWQPLSQFFLQSLCPQPLLGHL